MNPFTKHGAIGWPELQSQDAKSAVPFYEKVFGWKTETMPMPTGEYTVCKLAGSNAGRAGIMQSPHPNMHSYWGFYVTVDDVHATTKRAEELGAKVFLPPMHVPTVGTMSGFTDPHGAAIMAITYEPHPDMPEMPDVKWEDAARTHGAFSWFELRVPDPGAALKFYRDLFGWTTEENMMGIGPYHLISVGGVQIGGAFKPQGEMPPHWAGYVTVDDIDKSVADIAAAGGKVDDAGVIEVAEVGRLAMFQDPTGAHLAVAQYVSVEAS